jgi:hypothetical protein
MASREDRLKALGQRFAHTEVQETPPSRDQEAQPLQRPLPTVQTESRRSRRRHSWYLDTELVAKVDAAYKAVAHELYPSEVAKSDFLEACLNFALTHLGEVKAALGQG